MKQQGDLTFIMFPWSWVPKRKLSYPAEWAEPQPAGPACTWPRQAHGPCGCRGELSAAGEWPAGPGLRLQSSGLGRPAHSLQEREQTGWVRPRGPLYPESCLSGIQYHLPSSLLPIPGLRRCSMLSMTTSHVQLLKLFDDQKRMMLRAGETKWGPQIQATCPSFQDEGAKSPIIISPCERFQIKLKSSKKPSVRDGLLVPVSCWYTQPVWPWASYWNAVSSFRKWK